MTYIPPYLKNYKRLRRLKCLHPHEITLPGGRKVKVTREDLLQTRDKMNARAKTNTLATASTDHIATVDSLGNQHTKPSTLVNLLGYECVWEYGKFQDGKEWLYCDAFIRPDKYDEAKEMPFTSVEYHPNDKVVSNMAFTKHRPVLDVGTITPYHWERGEVNDAGMPVPLVAYSVESRQGPVVIYSTEQPKMSANPLKQFGEDMAAAAQKLIASSETPIIETHTGVGAVGSGQVKPAPTVVSLSTETVHPDTLKLRAIERRRSLEAIKAAGRNVDVDKEMQEWGDAPDQWFNVHLGLMAVSYSTQASGGAKVEPLGDTGNAEQEAKLASKAENIMKTRVVKGLPFMNFHQAYDRLKAEPGWNGID